MWSMDSRCLPIINGMPPAEAASTSGKTTLEYGQNGLGNWLPTSSKSACESLKTTAMTCFQHAWMKYVTRCWPARKKPASVGWKVPPNRHYSLGGVLYYRQN